MISIIKKYQSYVIATVLIILVFSLDRLSELFVLSQLENLNAPLKITPFFNFVWLGNDGISFGLLQGLPYGKWWLSIFAIVSIGFFFIWLIITESTRTAFALGLILGGALGNLSDRLVYGHVIDLFDLHIADYHWPAFNVPDSAIFAGAAILIVCEIFSAPNHTCTEQNIR